MAARYLGPEGMGRQSFIAFFALSVTTLLSGAFFVSLMRYVGETLGRGRPEAVRGLLTWAWRIEGGAAVAGAAILAGTGLAGADPRGAWLFAALASALGILHTVPSAVLMGLQRFRQASVVGLTTGLAGTGATVAVLAAGGGITEMFAVEAAVSVVNLAWTGRLARGRLDELAPRAEPAPELRRDVLRYAAASSIGIVLSFVVARRSELFFLERFSTDTEIALYSIVFAVTTALLRIPEALAAAVSPAVATLFGAGEHERIRSGFSRALRLIVLVVLPLTTVGLAVGPDLLELVYGEEYRGTRDVLLVMLSAFPLIPLAGLANALLVGLGRVRLPLVANGLAAAVDIGLAAALVPSLGAVGAAVANVGAQVAFAVAMLLYVPRLIGPLRLELAALARAAVAAAAAGVAAWAVVSALGGAAGVVLGGAAWAAVLVAVAAMIGVVPPDDAVWLEEAFARRGGARLGRVLRAAAGGRLSRRP